MKKLNQNGFTAFEIILLVLVLAALGFAGYVVYKKDKPTQNVTTTDSIKQQAKSETPKPTVENNDKYLVVKEWGVKFKLNDTNQEVKYTSKGIGSGSVFLSTARLDALAKATPGCEGASESVALSRAKVGDDRFGSPWTEPQLKEIGVKLGDYYYFQEGAQPCFFADDATMNKYKDSVSEIGTIRASMTGIYKTVTTL